MQDTAATAGSTPGPLPLEPLRPAAASRVLLGTIAASVVMAGIGMLFYQDLSNALQTNDGESLNTAEQTEVLINWISITVRLTMIVALCAWSSRWYGNLQRAGTHPDHYAMRWAGYIIPFASLYYVVALPQQGQRLMREVLAWHGATPSRSPWAGTLLGCMLLVLWVVGMLERFVFRGAELNTVDQVMRHIDLAWTFEAIRMAATTLLFVGAYWLTEEEGLLIQAANQRLDAHHATFRQAWAEAAPPEAEPTPTQTP